MPTRNIRNISTIPAVSRVEYDAFGGGRATVQGNFCKVLDIKPGVADVKQDIVLERAEAS